MSFAADPAPWPGVADPLPPDTPDYLESKARVVANPDEVLSSLREEIASGKKDPDVLFGAIAIAAQSITDATGAALGMRRDGFVVCVGRSGETAPALGARLNSESGISGECLRTGRALRCDDTETDPRVDAEVCRHLSLRSIAAVPVRSRLETIGILEVFSTSVRAFSEGDLAWLGTLAELADATVPPPVDEPVPLPTATPFPAPSLALPTGPRLNRSRMLVAAGAAAVLALAAFAVPRIWRGSTKPAPVAEAARPSARDEPASIPSGSETAQKLPERITPTAQQQKPARPRVVEASQNEPDDVVVRRLVAAGSSAQPPVDDSPSAPEVAVLTDSGMPSLGTVAPTIPTLEHPVSQGVTPLVLERRVTPRYPQEAKAIALGGAVVLHARISETGAVKDLKAVSGNVLLARAALAAVRQWRYRPATLDGKPISVETNITVTFKLP